MAFQFDWITNVQFAGSYVAQSEGYYTGQGLDVNLISGGPNVTVIPVLQANKALVGVVDPVSAAAANAQGGDIVIVGSKFQKSPTAVISLQGSPITTPEQMIGKRIGIGASSVTLMKAFFKANNLDYSKITVVPIQFDPAPLVAGTVDGYVGFSTNEAITVELEGHPVHSMLLADFGLEIYSDVYGVRKTSLQDDTNRALVKKFLTAEIRGWQSVLADPTSAVALTMSKYGSALKLDKKEQIAEAKAQDELVSTAVSKQHGLLWMDPASIAANVKSVRLSGESASTSLFDNSLLAEIYNGANHLT